MRLIPVFIIPLAQCATFHRNDFDVFRDTLFIDPGISDGDINVSDACWRLNVFVTSLKCRQHQISVTNITLIWRPIGMLPTCRKSVPGVYFFSKI